MLSKDLKVGQHFKVTPPDPEYPVRVCLENDGSLIVWGFPIPEKKSFWSMMGRLVQVEPIEKGVEP